jgi:radical SAM protein with 4Fe4S-binding SPASM domain
MNSIPSKYKKTPSKERICKDIDRVMEAVDSFGVVNIFGGEPFLHPHISAIVRHALCKDNFGAVIVNTNGALNMADEQIEGFNNGRVRLAFSNYGGQLEKWQDDKIIENFKKTEKMGIIVKMHNKLPSWNIPRTFYREENDIKTLIARKSVCGVVFLYIFDGKVYPCDKAMFLRAVELADYKNDYIDIDSKKNHMELKEAIAKLMSKKYYESCAHCNDKYLGLTDKAGEQGFDEHYIFYAS